MKTLRLAGTVLGIGLLAGTLSACGSDKQPFQSAPTNVVIDPNAGKHPTADGLGVAVFTQIPTLPAQAAPPAGVDKVSCALPADWKEGHTFICNGLNHSGGIIAIYHAVVQGSEEGVYHWAGSWKTGQQLRPGSL